MNRLIKKLNKLGITVHESIITHVIRRNVERYAKSRMGKAFRTPLGIFDKAHPVGTNRTEAVLKYLWKLLLDSDIERCNATDYDPELNVEEIKNETVINGLTDGNADDFPQLAWQHGYDAGLAGAAEWANDDQDEDRDNVNYTTAPTDEITKADLDATLNKQVTEFRCQLNTVKAANKSTFKTPTTPTTTATQKDNLT